MLLTVERGRRGLTAIQMDAETRNLFVVVSAVYAFGRRLSFVIQR